MAMLFISHAGRDKPIARRLLEALAREQIGVWLDEQQLHTGSRLSEELLGAIAESDLFVYLGSKYANESPWVQRELGYALERETNGGIRVIPIRIAGDDTDLPDKLDDRAYWTLEVQGGGGFARLAHELRSLSSAPAGSVRTRASSTVRIARDGLIHTMDQVKASSGSDAANVLFIDQNYARLDELYWRMAELQAPKVDPARQEYVNTFVESLHRQSRRIIGELSHLAGRYLLVEASSRHPVYEERGILRALHLLLHGLQWNVMYLSALESATEITSDFANAKHLPEAFDGHACEFLAGSFDVGKTKVPKHGHPLPDGVPLMPWGLTSPFGDMLDAEVGVAVGDVMARRFLAGTLSAVIMPDAAKLLYGLG